MIASMMLLLGPNEFNPAAVPRTLHTILTAEQLSSLPPHSSTRQPYVPGRPSTSGREFLPEPRILGLTRQNSNAIFTIQFEKRDGTLRNMIARIGVWNDANGDETNTRIAEDAMSYNPADYNLKAVFDMENGQYRTIATDRVTMIAIGESSYRTTSYRE